MALITSHDSQIHARAIAAVVIHFFHLLEFLSSDPDETIKNPQYSIYTKAINANIPSSQLIVIWISDIMRHKEVE